MAYVEYHITFGCQNVEDEDVIMELSVPDNMAKATLKSIGSNENILLFVDFAELRDLANNIINATNGCRARIQKEGA